MASSPAFAAPPSTGTPAPQRRRARTPPLRAGRRRRASLRPARRRPRCQTRTRRPDLQAIVDEIHAELAPRFGEGKPRRLHPAARPGRSAPLRPRGRRPRRQRARRRRRRRAVLDPEHLQGLPADPGARQARRGPLEARRPRALGLGLQLDHPARARGRASRAIRSSTPAPSSSPTWCSPGHSPREAIGEIVRFLRFLADDDDDRHRRRGRALRGRDRRAQLRAGPVHALLRPAGASGRPGARGLFPPLRHRDELPPARPRRAVPRRRRPQPADRPRGGLGPRAPAGSTR